MTELTVKRHRGILFMRGAVIDIYIPTYSATVFSFQLTKEVYAEMEIINGELGTKHLEDFFAVNKIPPTDFALVLQSPLFRKEFTLAPQEKLESLVSQYLDYVPFDSVLSKRIKTDAGVLIVAANGDLVHEVTKMFTETGSTVECVTALEGLSIIPKGGLSILTQLSAETMLKNISLIKQESFSLTPLRTNEEFEVVEEPDEKKEKSMLPLLVPVFIILMIVLGVVYYLSSSQPTSQTPKKSVVRPSP